MSNTSRRPPVVAARWAVALAAAAALAGCSTVHADTTSRHSTATITATTTQPAATSAERVATEQPQPTSNESAAQAIRTLDSLAVKGRAPKTGYSRAQFGAAWSDDVTVEGGHNGCDTRNDLLKSLRNKVIKPNTHGCVVLSGVLDDPYTGRSIPFQRGPQSGRIQVDHLVALLDAWQKGAQQLSVDQRRNLANDPRNLQLVDGPTNAAKGAGDAATWLPPNKGYRCTYVQRQIAVKSIYHLWVTAAEKEAMLRILRSC
ncbi:HNH endonuclease family protein [Gordonia otitidis]|uniref:HNH endonuclease family protein n=1 Tax=Gordonia otitidis TaxID=249058 RepID=UPI000A05B27B